MAEFAMKDIRTFAVVGHGQCGKTTLCDNIIYEAGVVNRLGSVEDKTSVSDYMDEEKERQVSVSSTVLNCPHKGTKFNIIDTPGYADFFGDSIAALDCVDFAVLMIDANSGIQVNTRKAWKILEQNNTPVIICVNKMDGEHLSVSSIISKVQDGLSSKCVPLNYPDGIGADFSSVINLLDKSAELDGEVSDLQNEMFETIIEGDEELLMRYLDDEDIGISELTGLLKNAIIEKSVIPILFSAASQSIGVKELMDFIANFGTAPGEGPVKPCYLVPEEAEEEEPEDAEDAEEDNDDEAGQETEMEQIEYQTGEGEPFLGRVFKVLTDPYVGKLSFIRVFTGTLKEGLEVYYKKGYKPCSLTQPLDIQGVENEPADSAGPGEIVAVSKIEEFSVGDTLSADRDDLTFGRIDFPEPMVSLAVSANNRADEQKIGPALKTLQNEDNLFTSEYNDETSELVIKGMGNLHLESILSRIQKRFDIEVKTKIPKIPYRETVTGKSDVSYRHKKQTGGHGQYGEVYIRVEPLGRGEGFEFADEIVGGAIPKQFIPAVEKGVRETMAEGIYAGFKIVDMRVTLYDGSHHDVDSSEMAFKTAASKALKDGFMKAKPALLEPIAEVEIVVPSRFMGNITGDITGRRGQMQGMSAEGDMQTIKAIVPEAELQTYSTELRSATGGEGTFTKRFSHYEVVPDNIAQKVISRYKKQEEEE